MIARLLVALFILGPTAGVAETTAQDRYDKLWNKRAFDFDAGVEAWGKPKAACVCIANSDLGAVGRIGVEAYCMIPIFDGSGAITSVVGCTGDWTYLGK
ncbi:MAG TPA: hypothetical protein VEL28_13815 [Candidatus Binatia bacterium]|nr:hypothetical protein [Candidatus Binatia bacterium]